MVLGYGIQLYKDHHISEMVGRLNGYKLLWTMMHHVRDILILDAHQGLTRGVWIFLNVPDVIQKLVRTP